MGGWPDETSSTKRQAEFNQKRNELLTQSENRKLATQFLRDHIRLNGLDHINIAHTVARAVLMARILIEETS